MDIVAEGQGFEPWEGRPSLIFKTSAFDRSATPPQGWASTAFPPCEGDPGIVAQWVWASKCMYRLNRLNTFGTGD